MRTKEELLEIFEEWLNDTVSTWICEYGAWDLTIEEYDIDPDEWEELQKLGLHDLYEKHRKRMTEE